MFRIRLKGLLMFESNDKYLDVFNKLNSLSQTLDSLDESEEERGKRSVKCWAQLTTYRFCCLTVAHFFSFIISYSESHTISLPNRALQTEPTELKDPEKSDNPSLGRGLITFMTALDIRLFYDMSSQTIDDTILWFWTLSSYLNIYLLGFCNGSVWELFRSGQLELMYFPFHVDSDIVYISAQPSSQRHQ